ncbi:oxidoreductase [Streptomyces sp. NPDC005388]|uniref:oxidoreductase n=1 Tax=Streptomyces sp. NPDC005388 TaxID=3156717 RepID=UPI0033A612B4
MKKWTLADMPDLTGHTAVVTGASSGLGLVTARELAKAGAHVVLAVRNVDKGKAAAQGMSGRTEVRHLDVADLRSVRAFAEHWSGPLRMLINNAGIMKVPLARTGDGFESQLATNYLGPFLLTNLLLPHVTDRVVTLSSEAHRVGHAHLDDPNFDSRKYGALDAYADSKLYDAMFGIELQRRLEASGSRVRSLIAHPGLAATSLLSHRPVLGAMMNNPVMRLLINDAERGALPTLYAATADLAGGSYIGPDGLVGISGRHPKVRKASRAARDAGTGRRLWDITTELTAA